MERKSRTKVVLIFRKPQPQYFSIEKVFDLIANKLHSSISVQKVYMPYHALSLTTIFNNIRAARRVKCELYHVTGDVHYVVLGLPAGKTILTIHDCVFMRQTTGIKRKLLYFLFLKWPVNRSRIVTTISENTKQDIIRYTGCSSDKVVVITNPSDERFTFTTYTFNKKCPVMLFVGITPNKNLFRVIEALKGIFCRLHIIGKIPAAEKAQLINDRISFFESCGLSEEELRDAYGKADIVLFPSLFEGFGLPILEAQLSGRPVITSNISPMKEVAGEGACLVDPFSVASIRKGINKVIEDDAYRQMLLAKGLSNAQKYRPETIADAYTALYHRVQSANT